MSAALAVSSAALAQSSAAQAQAHEAKKIACHGMMSSYTDATATVESKRAYAECVNVIHPSEMTGGEIIIAKVLIVAAIIGAVVGVYKGWRDDGFMFAVLGGMVGMLLAPVVVGAFVLLAWGATLLFQ